MLKTLCDGYNKWPDSIKSNRSRLCDWVERNYLLRLKSELKYMDKADLYIINDIVDILIQYQRDMPGDEHESFSGYGFGTNKYRNQ